MKVTVAQEKFLSNSSNKTRLIRHLQSALLQANFTVIQARDDADVLIVNTALITLHSPVLIVSEDVDILILLVGLTPRDKTIFYMKMSKGNQSQTIYSNNSLNNFPFCRDNVLFLHAFSGCDTTSQALDIFKRPNQTKEDIFESGMTAPLFLYKAPQKIACINSYRYICFAKTVTNKAVNLANLPPTADAAKQHYFRVYLQVQSWLSNDMPPEEWGWFRDRENILVPKIMTLKLQHRIIS
ncbi:hypothetical protein ALC57_16836 [Trachymyrmex cornetzi]|uniref:Uncharacterized protein n=1 Tax=Trachymyrmex cornetzi TaxID=471704 RepID=A0A151IUE4_9HYME|nr:hypothetical protein ALC57_16836 [Trachymyrmex cornetzi]